MTRWLSLLCILGGLLAGRTSAQCESLLLEARLEGVVDSQVLISTAASAAQRRILVKRGVPEVKRSEEVRHDTLFRGRYYRRFGVAAEVSADDLLLWRERLGEEIKVVLRRGPRNHLVVESLLGRG
ncbi:MAG: hypothetical protein AAFU79_10505 [Myxococcota bacterium]